MNIKAWISHFRTVLHAASEIDVWVQHIHLSSFLWATWELLLQTHLCGQVSHDVALLCHSRPLRVLFVLFSVQEFVRKRMGWGENGGGQKTYLRVKAQSGSCVWLIQA